MEFVDKTIGLDSNCFIYYIEKNSKYFDFLETLFSLNNEGKCSFVTSVITLIEVTIHPLRLGKQNLVNEYEDILINSSSLNLCDISVEISKFAAKLRSKYDILIPDAIQIATSILGDAEYFITNDKRLKIVKETEIILLDNLIREF